MKSQSMVAEQLRYFFLTLFALVAFAGNSVLCRLALGQQMIDPNSFTFIRLFSGALTMMLVMRVLNGSTTTNWFGVLTSTKPRSWLAALMLFAYAALFSLAYMKLDTATGALVLFAVVQFCMIGVNLYQGYRPTLWEWLGVLTACGGFILLMLPSATRPSIPGLLLMGLSGIAWTIYTLEGKQAKSPINNTAENFVRTLPLLLPLVLLTVHSGNLTLNGTILAIVSGSMTSALGYTIWYMALRKLSITQAAISQLSVPLIAAAGAVIFVAEPLSMHLAMCSVLILSGILLVTLNKR